MFSEVIKKEISYPAEYGYGLVANKWFFKKFDGKIGLIGAKLKVNLNSRVNEKTRVQRLFRY